MAQVIERIVKQVHDEGVAPLTPRHLVAFLETQGWTDQAAQQEGFTDVFALSAAVYPAVAQIAPQVAASHEESEGKAARAFWHFLRGVLFAMPMILGGWASLYYGLTPWSYNGFGVPEATGIVLAMILSFLATGGMTQATARRGLFLISLREYALARRTAIRMVLFGLLFSLLLGLVVAVLLLVAPVLMWDTVRMILIFYPFLCVIWLCLGLLYMLRRELAFTVVVAAGIALVVLLSRSAWFAGLVGAGETAIILAQVIGLLFIAVVSLLLALWFFHRLERRGNAIDFAARPGAWPAAIRQLLPFFLYGLLYFAFLYMDRILAWSTPSLVHPQAIWFIGPYELGLTWATLVLLLPMGVVEMGIWLLVERLYREPARVPAANVDGYRRRMLRLWGWLQVAVAAVAIPSAIGVWFLLRWISHTGLIPVAPLSIPVSAWVFVWAAIGYVLLAGGLLNILLLFTANRPWPAVRATAGALLTALVVGFIASRFWFRCFDPAGCTPDALLRYPQAIVGLVAGAAVLWLLAGRAAHRAIARTDYLLYLNT